MPNDNATKQTLKEINALLLPETKYVPQPETRGAGDGQLHALGRCDGVDVNGVRCTEPATTTVRVIGYQCSPYSETWQTIGACASCAEKIAPTD